jgi:uncharacterized protein YdhG (YjbR/CyaY superfamily)
VPGPKRIDPDDFYARLPEIARAHLRALQQLCRENLPNAHEVLQWNTPAFVQDGVRLVMLQAFKAHCSLRFPTRQFAAHRAAVQAAGYEAGEGFVKLPYERELPTELLAMLLRARLAEYEATGATWTSRE